MSFQGFSLKSKDMFLKSVQKKFFFSLTSLTDFVFWVYQNWDSKGSKSENTYIRKNSHNQNKHQTDQKNDLSNDEFLV